MYLNIIVFYPTEVPCPPFTQAAKARTKNFLATKVTKKDKDLYAFKEDFQQESGRKRQKFCLSSMVFSPHGRLTSALVHDKVGRGEAAKERERRRKGNGERSKALPFTQ